jgi:hypothetical protein
MKKLNFSLMLFCIVLLSSCAKVYYSPESLTLARRHKIIAVLTPTVNLPAQKKMTLDQIKEQEKQDAVAFQQNIYSWLLDRKNDGKIKVNILDVNTTNAKLAKATMNGEILSPVEMAKVLNVDAVLTSNFQLTKPMSEGAAIATTFLFGFGTTNRAIANMELYDTSTEQSIWNFKHEMSGGILDNVDSMVDNLMRVASKKLPYTKLDK